MASWSYASYACASYVFIRAILRGLFFEKPGKYAINSKKY